MPPPQLLVHLAFSLSSILGYLGWMHLLASERRRRLSSPERLLNGHQRLELEQRVVAALQHQWRRDTSARQQWVALTRQTLAGS